MEHVEFVIDGIKYFEYEGKHSVRLCNSRNNLLESEAAEKCQKSATARQMPQRRKFFRGTAEWRDRSSRF